MANTSERAGGRAGGRTSARFGRRSRAGSLDSCRRFFCLLLLSLVRRPSNEAAYSLQILASLARSASLASRKPSAKRAQPRAKILPPGE